MSAEPDSQNENAPAESLLRRLYAEILKVETVGLDDSFFALSGDSIAVMKLVSRARNAGLDIEIRDVFAAKTVRRLAAASLAARMRGKSDAGDRPRTSVELPELSEEELDEIISDVRNRP
ncbi:phosphopantetheine-binding protein [Streptomyces sp. NBC_01518]|uniref:phosphopantetheine-binding protein n=1 Tax=Streptomyces sp. NBC_01518 TaxID=2903891 RepID=UPI00386DD4E4